MSIIDDRPKLLYLARRRPDQSGDGFLRRWREHAALAQRGSVFALRRDRWTAVKCRRAGAQHHESRRAANFRAARGREFRAGAAGAAAPCGASRIPALRLVGGRTLFIGYRQMANDWRPDRYRKPVRERRLRWPMSRPVRHCRGRANSSPSAGTT